ncbi:MAG: hypothetical protein CMQ43_02500 [Gammaproteobacteria bacterium]|nr:hypothetical protein [Gammaproteobacteria bacterium]
MNSNNGFHAQEFAMRLTAVGAEVAVASNDPIDSISTDKPYRMLSHDELRDADPFGDVGGPSVVHAWTPREGVRRLCSVVSGRWPDAAVVVHLEDDEELLTELSIGMPWQELLSLPPQRLDQLTVESIYHPRRGPEFLATVDGLSWVIEGLGRFNPGGLASLRLPPLADESLFHPRPLNRQLRHQLGIPARHMVISYCGNVHAANRAEVEVLYRAVDTLNRLGVPTTLLRSGSGWVSGMAGVSSAHAIELGWVERESIPDILAAADVLVQPGVPGPFNDNRVPCKLPEYFAIGRPVVLPKSNLGLIMQHGVDAYVVERADVDGVVRAVQALAGARELRHRLAEGAVAVYLRRLRESDLGVRAVQFYGAVCAARVRPA